MSDGELKYETQPEADTEQNNLLCVNTCDLRARVCMQIKHNIR